MTTPIRDRRLAQRLVDRLLARADRATRDWEADHLRGVAAGIDWAFGKPMKRMSEAAGAELLYMSREGDQDAKDLLARELEDDQRKPESRS